MELKAQSLEKGGEEKKAEQKIAARSGERERGERRVEAQEKRRRGKRERDGSLGQAKRWLEELFGAQPRAEGSQVSKLSFAQGVSKELFC